MNCPARPLIAALITVACFAPSSQAAAPPANLVVVVGTAGQGNIGVIQIGAGTAKMTGNLGLTGTGNTISVQANGALFLAQDLAAGEAFQKAGITGGSSHPITVSAGGVMARGTSDKPSSAARSWWTCRSRSTAARSNSSRRSHVERRARCVMKLQHSFVAVACSGLEELERAPSIWTGTSTRIEPPMRGLSLVPLAITPPADTVMGWLEPPVMPAF